MKSAAAWVCGSVGLGTAAADTARDVRDDADGDGVVVGAVAVGDVEADGVGEVLGSTEPVGDGVADAVVVAVVDVVGVGSALGSASALVQGAATSAAAASRVPTSRNRAAGVVVDIGAFLERFVTYGPNHRETRHSGSVPHSSTGEVEPLAPVGHSDSARR